MRENKLQMLFTNYTFDNYMKINKIVKRVYFEKENWRLSIRVPVKII